MADWRLLASTYPNSSYRAKGLYWLGKLGASPPEEGDGDYWDVFGIQTSTKHKRIITTDGDQYINFQVIENL